MLRTEAICLFIGSENEMYETYLIHLHVCLKWKDKYSLYNLIPIPFCSHSRVELQFSWMNIGMKSRNYQAEKDRNHSIYLKLM